MNGYNTMEEHDHVERRNCMVILSGVNSEGQNILMGIGVLKTQN